MSLAGDIIDRVFFPGRDVHAIPVLDGGFSPNLKLEQAAPLARIERPDAVAFDPDGGIFVSAGKAILGIAPDGTALPFAEVATGAGAIAWTAAGTLLACVDGQGLQAFDRAGKGIGRLDAVDGTPIRCPTAVAVAADGTIFLTDGSRRNGTGEWLQDLMQNRPGSGRVIACNGDLSAPRILADDLSWPCGIAVSHGEDAVLVTESWRHRLLSLPRSGGSATVLVRNFAGYPSRIARGGRRDYWIAFFALRSQLTEFVLRERRFRERMMAQVPPAFWIGPSLGGQFDYREPTQVGRIKKLGIQKPWAPARSYGLVGRLDGSGTTLDSLHSRVSGSFHGVTAACEHDGRLAIVSKGHGKLALVPLAAAG